MPGCECSDAPVSLPTPASTWKRIAPPWLDVEGESGAIPLGHCTNGGDFGSVVEMAVTGPLNRLSPQSVIYQMVAVV